MNGMQQVVNGVQGLVKMISSSRQPSKLNDVEFMEFLEEHPRLTTVLSSAIREGNLTVSTVTTYFPSELLNSSGKKGAEGVAEAMMNCEKLAGWLVDAGRRFHFRVFDAQPPKQKVSIVWAGSFEKGSRLEEANAFLMRQKEGGLVAFIQGRRMGATCLTYKQISRELKEKTGVFIDQGHISQIAHRFKIVGSPSRPTAFYKKRSTVYKKRQRRSRGRRFLKGSAVYKANEKLKQTGQGGIIPFIAKRRSGWRPKTYRRITTELVKTTGITVHHSNVYRIAHRYRITTGGRR